MRFVSLTFVDHQPEIQYPVAYTTRNLDMFDAIYIFASDSKNADAVRKAVEGHRLLSKIRIIEIGHGVAKPGDIATCYNKCLEWLRQNDAFDYVFVHHADVTLTNRAFKFVEEFCAAGDNKRPPVQFILKNVKLHCPTYISHFCTTLIGRGSQGAYYTEDGSYTHSYWMSSDSPSPEVWQTLEIGCLSVGGYGRKLQRHSKTWADVRLIEMARLYREDLSKFVEYTLRYISTHDMGGQTLSLMPENDPDYQNVVTYFGLEKERAMIGEVMKNIGWTP